MKVAVLMALALSFTGSAGAYSSTSKEYRIQKQLARYYHADGYIKSIGKAASRTIYSSNPRVRHRWRGAVRYLKKVRTDAHAKLAALRAPPWPPHHALWMCLLPHEGGTWKNKDTGGNGHYGGLQMHVSWGHGTSKYASDDSQLVQENAAEEGYHDSHYSRSYLIGQWGQTIGYCWQYV